MNHTTQHVPLKEDIDRYFAHEVLPRSGYGLSSGTLADSLRSPRRRGVNVDVVSIGQSLQTLDVSWLRQDAQRSEGLFQQTANMTDEQRLGSHAKFWVADGQQADVGSANLTEPGFTLGNGITGTRRCGTAD